ncbi:MAG: hypothetical protein ACFFD2_22630 [Promethearchaeota archaeon]
MIIPDNRSDTIRVFSEKVGKIITREINPENVPIELKKNIGMSNEDYGI